MSEKIGKLIASRLKALKKGQAWLAEEAEVSVNAVSKWTKTGKIARKNVARVAELLNVSADELVSGEEHSQLKSKTLMGAEVRTAEEMRVLTAFRLADEVGVQAFEAAVETVFERLEQTRRHQA